MEWLIAFAAGALAGSLIWPFTWAVSHSPPTPVRVRQSLTKRRFKRTFGIAPTRDEDVQAVLQPVVGEHVRHLHEQASRATDELNRCKTGRPASFIELPRTVAALQKAKARKVEAERRLAVAVETASLWRFNVPAAGEESAAVPVEQAAASEPKQAAGLQRATSLQQTRKQAT